MADWRFYSADIMTGTVRDELPLQNATITKRLNAPSTLHASIAFRHPKAIPQNLDVETTMLIATRDGVVQFAGPLLDIQLGEGAELLSLQCEDLWNHVRRRLLRSRQGMTYATGKTSRDVTFAGVDQFRIVDDLIAHIQTVSGGDLGITVAYNGLSGVTRDRTYRVEEQNYAGLRIEELANVQNGFDWALETSGPVDDLTHTLRLSHPRRGRQTDYVLSWDGGTTLLGMSGHWSSRDRITRFVAVGAGEGDRQLQRGQSDPNLIGVLPMLESHNSWLDVSVASTLIAHAQRELAYRKRRSLTLAVTLDPTVEPRLGTFIVGDTMRVVISDGFVQVDEFMRVTALSVKVDENGAETMPVELEPLNRFL